MTRHSAALLENPWLVDPAGFPQSGTGEEKLLFLLNYAALAPSVLNTQPWRFRLVGDSLELRADPHLMLPVLDPEQRELIISCGAALLNLRVAIRAFGHVPLVTLFPDSADPSLLAVVALPSRLAPEPGDRALRDAIVRRRTAFKPFPGSDVKLQTVAETLTRASFREGAIIGFADQAETRAAVAALLARAARTQFAMEGFPDELARWARRRLAEAADRVAAEPPDVSTQMSFHAARNFGAVGDLVDAVRDRAAGAPLLALLSTANDRPADWLAAGQALERVLLNLTAAGLSGAFFNQPIEVRDTRAELARLFAAPGRAQILLGIGAAAATPPTHRRPMSEIVEIAQP